ncbi:BspA family leucine-rich repeat surface protein [Winogradskyella sp. 3972H.M.0a.05]|uniref:BspA family leucine-rich repeat surface protein n=1 Tax=Winogradskyella sp. 3972H.M.0a.05 TaxID=2950277 RepID=UPI003397B952
MKRATPLLITLLLCFINVKAQNENLFITTWKTDNPGVTNSTSIRIPTHGVSNFYFVDWTYDGVTFDPELELYQVGFAEHDYGTPGIYTVAISGVIADLDFGGDNISSPTDNKKILTIEQWGDGPWIFLDGAFQGCSNLNITNPNIDTPDLSNVTSLQNMFKGATSFTGDYISNWDVSTIDSMEGMFNNATSFNGDISGWNVSNVTRMHNMFENATSFNQDISGWDVSNVITMLRMFFNASSFDQDLGDWDLSSVNNMFDMFNGATLSTVNYDNTLIGWANDSSGIDDDGIDDIPSNINFHGGNSLYCFAQPEHNLLTALVAYDWTITDGGFNCTESAFVTTWKTDNPGTSSSTEITIPTTGGGYDYDVDWTYDGVTFNAEDSNVTGSITHDYGASGEYTVAIRGDFPRIFFNNGGDKDKILRIEQWGNTQWISMANAFRGCSNLNITNPDIDAPDLSNVTEAFDMFRDATSFTGDYIASWDTSNITDMINMFRGASSFNGDIGTWDVSAVTSMVNTFNGAASFNRDIGTWNVGNVQSMIGMFLNAISFDQELSNWDLSSIIEMNGMFSGATLSTANYDDTLIGWAKDSSGVDNDGIDDIPSGITFNGGNSKYCFALEAHNLLTAIVVYDWDITDGGLDCVDEVFVTTWKTDNPGTSILTQITIPTTGGGYDYDVDWTYDGITFNAEDFNVTSSITHDYGTPGEYTVAIRGDFPRIFFNNGGDKDKILRIEQWGSVQWSSMANAFRGCSNLNITNPDIDAPDLSNVTEAFDMFRDATSFTGDYMSNWDVSNITDMINMFRGASSFNGDIGAWDVSAVTSTVGTFRDASSFNRDIGSWDVSNIESMIGMFLNATSFDQELSNWDLSSILDMNGMFNGATLSTANYDDTLIGWATDSSGVDGDMVDDIPSGFSFNGGNSKYCVGETARGNLETTYSWDITDGGQDCINEVFVTTWKTDNPGSSGPTEISIPIIPFADGLYNYEVDWTYDGVTFNAEDSNVTGSITHDYGEPGTYTVAIRGLFPHIFFANSGDKDKILTIDQWGTNQWASMVNAFNGCSNLNIINPNIDAPDLSNVTEAFDMFRDATSFTGDYIANWDTSTITDMDSMFRGASLFNGDISGWNTSSVTSMVTTFSGATSFNQDISGWDVSNVTIMFGMFDNATSFDQNLGDWDISSVVNMENMFDGVTLSTANYDATLMGWAADSSGLGNDGIDDIPSGITFHGGSSKYCLGEAAWTSLDTTHSWTITDGGLDCRSEVFVTSWKTDNPGVSGNTEITIPTTGTGYNYDVDWTYDGVTFNAESTNVTGDVTHNYGAIGEYTVAIRGNFPQIYFNGAGDKDKILTIEQWGSIKWMSMANAFKGCSNLDITNPNIDAPDLSNVTLAFDMFEDATSFTGNYISNWDTSNITSMNDMFYRASAFNGDITAWDVSNVTAMLRMLNRTSFNRNLGDWDISNVFSMGGMLTLATLSTANYDATLIGWATDSSGVADDGIDDVPSGVDFNGGFSNYCNGEAAWISLDTTYNWTILDGGLDCTDVVFVTIWQTNNPGASSDTEITIPTFPGGTYNYEVDWTYDGITFNAESTNVTGNITHDYGAIGEYTVAIRGQFPQIFFAVSGDNNKILTIEQWGSNPWTSMDLAFVDCSNLNIINPDIDTPDLSNVTNMASMFRNATSFNGNINSWDVGNITNMYELFRGATSFTQDLNGWDVSNVSTMQLMFEGASAFNGDISSWNVSGVENMNNMFRNASSFDQDLGNWDLSSINSINNMFFNATLSTANYDATLIGWATDSSGIANDGIDDIPTGEAFSGGNSTYCNGEAARISLDTTYGWTITDGGLDCNFIQISPQVYLQGASLNPNLGEESLMRDDLRLSGYVPTTSPYGDGLTMNGSVLTTTGPDAIVDWVWLELRDGSSNTTIIDSRSALLQRDGDVVDVDGSSPVEFVQSPSSYYIAIKHRNHLGIMSASVVALNATATTVDFTDGSVATFGTNAQTSFGMPSGVQGMWAGDANGDGKVNIIGAPNDANTIRDAILNDPINQIIQFYGFTVSGYTNEDVNLTGGANIIGAENDANVLRDNVLNHPINLILQFYGYNILEQLPAMVPSARIGFDTEMDQRNNQILNND